MTDGFAPARVRFDCLRGSNSACDLGGMSWLRQVRPCGRQRPGHVP